MFNPSEFLGWLTLKLRLAERRAVSSDEDLWFSLGPVLLLFDFCKSTYKLGLAGAEGLESRLLAHGDLSTLHNQSQTAGDGVTGFLSLYIFSLARTIPFTSVHVIVDKCKYLGHCD